MKSRLELAAVCLVGCMSTLLSACGECENNGVVPHKGYALAIGLNKVDPGHYEGRDGALSGCEPDAQVMFDIAKQQGLEAEKLLTASATRAAVVSRLDKYARDLKSGDLLVVSYSGHGGTLPDENGDEDELVPGDLLDETWLLYDGQLLDDELAVSWSKFKKGVRILLFSDSCHSGTVLRFTKPDFDAPPPNRVRELTERWQVERRPRLVNPRSILENPAMREALRVRPGLRDRMQPIDRSPMSPTPAAPDELDLEIFENRSVPFSTLVATHTKHRDFYRQIGTSVPKESDLEIPATVILISGCQDDQYAADLGFNGLFTWRLNEVWNAGTFAGDHRAFHEAIRAKVLTSNPSQKPNYKTTGTPNLGFENAQPYAVEK